MEQVLECLDVRVSVRNERTPTGNHELTRGCDRGEVLVSKPNSLGE
jgi:hypothetical protein